jgi:hypothetical protein
MRLRAGAFGMAVLALIGAGRAVGTQPEPAAGILHQLDHPVRSVAGETIRIVNPFGNVRVRAIPEAARPSIRVTVQSSVADAVPARLAVDRHSAGPAYAVEAIKPADALVRADLVVALPDRAGLDISLRRGDFAMHAATYPVRVRADSGRVQLRTAGTVDVEVGAGRVIYNPPNGEIPAGGRIATSAASVDVLARHAGPLNFRVVSGPAVTTDSPELLATRRLDGRAVLLGEWADAALLSIRTDHAPVRIVLEGQR